MAFDASFFALVALILFFVLPGGSSENAVATVALGSAAAAVSK